METPPSIILDHWCVTWQGHQFLCRNLSNIKILNRRNGYATLDIPLTLGDLIQHRMAHGLRENLMAHRPYSQSIPFLTSSNETPGIELLPKVINDFSTPLSIAIKTNIPSIAANQLLFYIIFIQPLPLTSMSCYARPLSLASTTTTNGLCQSVCVLDNKPGILITAALCRDPSSGKYISKVQGPTSFSLFRVLNLKLWGKNGMVSQKVRHLTLDKDSLDEGVLQLCLNMCGVPEETLQCELLLELIKEPTNFIFPAAFPPPISLPNRNCIELTGDTERFLKPGDVMKLKHRLLYELGQRGDTQKNAFLIVGAHAPETVWISPSLWLPGQPLYINIINLSHKQLLLSRNSILALAIPISYTHDPASTPETTETTICYSGNSRELVCGAARVLETHFRLPPITSREITDGRESPMEWQAL
uniref:dUTPase-related protein n=1 Tax=Wood mouse herpesvirus TaxID=432370 RepID=D0PPA2_9GAMA|nr:dUTPase-related protein [Wood mouse herpesvirus]